MNSVAAQRTRRLREGRSGSGPVVYWMSRDQRAVDNDALLAAQEYAFERRAPLAVVFCRADTFGQATRRAYGFMLRGLAETAHGLAALNIPFVLLRGNPAAELPRFLSETGAAALFTDFDPLRIKREWIRKVVDQVRIPVFETDAHNAVPAWLASPKREWSAATFRRKIAPALEEWLTEYKPLLPHPFLADIPSSSFNPGEILSGMRFRADVPEAPDIQSGPVAAQTSLAEFLLERLPKYGQRNDPNAAAVSRLSPYLHFGQLSPRRAALEARKAAPGTEALAGFLEQLIVRRELADNYCLYEPDYDNPGGWPDWARQNHQRRREDPRPYLYTTEQFEQAATHDALWNAAQNELRNTGYMHGYMRMYWAKKILEWSATAEEAHATAVLLIDRYALDGRDPNGYAGIAWSIGGVHDRPWPDRPVFGAVRCMTAGGCKGKFDVKAYIRRFSVP